MTEKNELPALEDRVNWDHVNPDVKHAGRGIVLPELPSPMSYRAGSQVLAQKADLEEQPAAVSEWLDGHPLDALVAFSKAMQTIYGWTTPVPKKTIFGPQPPEVKSIRVGPGYGDTVQVPYGCFSLPGVDGTIETQFRRSPEGKVMLHIGGTIRTKDVKHVRAICAVAREYLAKQSIYRGKALRLPLESDRRDIDWHAEIEFLNPGKQTLDELVLNQVERDQVEATLWTPIRHTKECLKHDIPLNRGVLLEGVYGTGKSMTAHATARVCLENGWTYIVIEDVRALRAALLFAKRYQPAVVFAEDIDQAMQERDELGQDILNTIDGVLSKDSQVITVLTTNHVEKLDRAMLRPGRLDAVITIAPPDEQSVVKLVNLYSRGLIKAGEDLTQVGKVLAGEIPATIREVVERSKLAKIAGGTQHVTAEQLVSTAKGMKAHLDLLRREPENISAGDRLAKSLVEVLKGSGDLDDLTKAVADVDEAIDEIDSRTTNTNGMVSEMHNRIC